MAKKVQEIGDKYKRQTFSVNKKDWDNWEIAIKELVRRRIFKSKTDAFITFVYFLLQADDKEIEDFKKKSIILPLDEPEVETRN